jgi:hypothetical protein
VKTLVEERDALRSEHGRLRRILAVTILMDLALLIAWAALSDWVRFLLS